ncbi:MAG: B12-binding domain-containing radical SAM protein [Thermoplasmatales archaeon]|nr:B12-binding domain-containing radical SAM protein [Thermoplasmatales archaeon]
MAEDSKKTDGIPIVLAASRVEANEFDDNPFSAFICTFPKKLSGLILKEHLENMESNKNGSAKRTIYGLRKVESILIDRFGKENVVASHYDNLNKFIGKKTKIVGISTMDPMGLAYVSTTYNSLIGFGGEALNASEFKKLVTHPSIQKYRPKVIVGGQGSWQISEANLQEKLGIDVIFQGEGEKDLIEVFDKLMKGENVPKYFEAKKPDREKVPLIKHASSYGMVEIMRGCGRGCQFCSPTMRTKYSFPIDHIMNEVEVNIKEGAKSIFTVTEDIFLYKSKKNFLPNRKEVVKLYKTIASYPGVEHILLSHASFAPVIYDKKLLDELTPILIEKTRWTPQNSNLYKKPFISIEMGIETGSVRLMKKYMKGKALPYSVDKWPELVVEAIGYLNDHDWWPLCTIMTGQPDETEEDVIATLNLIDDLRNHNSKMFYTPVLFIPLKEAILGNSRRTNLSNLTERQWEVLARSWKNNIDFWTPDLKKIYGPGFFFVHWFYYRWKHGKKSTRPMLRLAGFPVAGKIEKQCNPDYCIDQDKGILKDIFEQIKERFF